MTRSIRLSVLTGFQPCPINLSQFFQARNAKLNLCSILYLSHALVRYPFGHAYPSNEDVLECWSLWSLSSLYRFTYRSKTTYIYILYVVCFLMITQSKEQADQRRINYYRQKVLLKTILELPYLSKISATNILAVYLSIHLYFYW